MFTARCSPRASPLRKLTKIKDVDDKWYYCRYWEPEFFLYFMLFLKGRRLLQPLETLRAFAVVVEEEVITARTDLSGLGQVRVDRAGDMTCCSRPAPPWLPCATHARCSGPTHAAVRRATFTRWHGHVCR